MSEAFKFDEEKPDLSLLPAGALQAVAGVLMHGAKKYGRHNWRKGMNWSRPLAAAMRHIFEHMDGTDEDYETGEDVIAHAVCELLFLLEYKLSETGTDDRWVREPFDDDDDEDELVTGRIGRIEL